MVLAFLFLIDFLFLFFIIKIIKNNQKNTIFTLISQKNGKKILFFLSFCSFLFFLLKTSFYILESNLLLKQTFYFEFNEWTALFLVLLFLFFTLTFSFKNFAKVAEMIKLPLFLFLMIVFLICILNLNLIETIPFFERGILPFKEGVSHSIFYFSDSLLLLLFVGKVKIEKNFTKEALVHFFIASLFVVFFVFSFYSIFGEVAFTKSLGILSIFELISMFTATSYLEFMFTFVICLFLLFAISLYFYAAKVWFECMIKGLKQTQSSILLILILGVTLILFQFNHMLFLQFLLFGLPVFVFLQYILPTILLFVLGKRRKNYVKKTFTK